MPDPHPGVDLDPKLMTKPGPDPNHFVSTTLQLDFVE
jgi:hypothetical protein